MSSVILAPPIKGMPTALLIRVAFGRNASKQLEAAMKITRGQARRIAWTGYVPFDLRGAFCDAVDAALEIRRKELEEALAVARALAHQRKAYRA